MGDLEDFHRDFLPRFIDAQRAFHNGDPEPNIALWSTADPVTLFAARGLVDAGSERVTKTFRFVASTFSGVRSFEWEMLASGGGREFCLHRRCRAVHRFGRWRPSRADRAPGNARVSPRGRRLARSAPPRRPQAARPSRRLSENPRARRVMR